MAYPVPPSPISEEPKIWSQWGGCGKGIQDSLGSRWTDLGTIDPGNASIEGIIYLGNGIFIATSYDNGTMLRSTDYGLTWKSIELPGVAPTPYSPCYLGNGIVLVGDEAQARIFRSTDYGLTWANQGTPVPAGALCEGFIYCGNGIVLGLGDLGFTRSTDYGVTWSFIPNPVPATTLTMDGCYLGNGIVISTATDAAISHVVRSTDYGLTWEDLGEVVVGLSIYMSFTNLGNGVVIASALNTGQIVRSTDYGKTWQIIEPGFPAAYLACDLANCGDGVVVMVVKDNINPVKVYRSTDYGLTWQDTKARLGAEIAVGFSPWNLCFGDGILLVGTYTNGKIFRSVVGYASPFEDGTQNLSHHTTATGATTLTTSHAVICVSTVTSRNITLPSAATCDGRRYVIKRIGATAAAHVSLKRSGADTIDGAATTTITTTLGAREIIADGTNSRWLVINEVD